MTEKLKLWLERLLITVQVLILVSFGVLITLGFKRAKWLPWQTIRVYASSQQVTQHQVKIILASLLKGPMLSDRLNKLIEAFKANPWTQQVALTRKWPGVLELDLIERTPIAIWLDHEIVDSKGQRLALSLAQQPVGELPKLMGSEAMYQVILANFRALQPLLKQQNWQLSYLCWHPGHYWELKIAGGSRLLFFEANLVAQFGRFIELYPEILRVEKKTPQYIDFRYQDGNFAVKH